MIARVRFHFGVTQGSSVYPGIWGGEQGKDGGVAYFAKFLLSL